MPRNRRPVSSAPFVSPGVALVAAALGVAFVGACAGDDSNSSSPSSGGSGPGAGTGGGAGAATGGGGASSSSTGGTATGGGGASGCTGDDDCKSDPNGNKCDTATGDCVGCVPDDDTCDIGQFCDPATKECVIGCNDPSDCNAPLVCDDNQHKCVGCSKDPDCPPGSICSNETCVAGCSPQQDCQVGFACCGTQCFDLTDDEDHCGDCNTVCVPKANAEALCQNSSCTMGPCDAAFADCNLDPSDGCEHNVLQDGACVCTPGSTQSCYQGSPGTQNVGPCKGGLEACNPGGTGWGACIGQTLPATEQCFNGIDEDCNGVTDDVADADGDGWTKCVGDCCDALSDGCPDPKLVNPGAFEVAANNVDDDCDGVKDNPLPTCDIGLASNSNTALDYAKAIDLCQTTVENPPTLQQKKWGVISAALLKADGSAGPAVQSRSIRTGFGTAVTPLKGNAIAVLSTGVAADENDVNPNYVATFQNAAGNANDTLTTSGFPADWLAANGNNLPNAPGCPDPAFANLAYNPMMLKVRVRVPTNAKSFNVSTFFLSSEYPEWVCSPYNDFFVTLLDSTFVPGAGEQANPLDKNLAFYDPPPAGAPFFPVGVNLAFGNTGLFNQCLNGATGCASGSVPGNTNACTGNAQLVGTGFGLFNPTPKFAGDPGYCGANNQLGGGTGWLITGGNVKPGETIEVRFAVWDTSDAWYDSVSLIDNFVWSLSATTPGTHE